MFRVQLCSKQVTVGQLNRNLASLTTPEQIYNK